MIIIVYHAVGSHTSPRSYNATMKIGYLLADEIFSVGIDNQLYYLPEIMKQLSFNQKIDFMKKSALPNEDVETPNYHLFEQTVKNYNKTKNKSSKMIVAHKQIMKVFDDIFENEIERQSDLFESVFGLKRLKELIDDKFGFLRINNEDGISDEGSTLEEILSLQFESEVKNKVLLFLNLDMGSPYEDIDFEFVDCNSVAAENSDTVYGAYSFKFPWMNSLSSNDVKTVANQMAESLIPFKEKINAWIEICYQNPNSIAGLEYFRTHINPIIHQTEEQALNNPIIKNASQNGCEPIESQLIFAQMPIYQIWNLWKQTNNITSQQLNWLLDLKQKENPLYEGRWPVMIYKRIGKKAIIEEPATDQIVKSVRKTIKLE